MRIGLDAGFLDFLNHRVGGIVIIDVIDHHIRAGLPQSDRHPFADPGIGTRDQRFLPVSSFGTAIGGAVDPAVDDSVGEVMKLTPV